jgi:hypothetical protein
MAMPSGFGIGLARPPQTKATRGRASIGSVSQATKNAQARRDARNSSVQ